MSIISLFRSIAECFDLLFAGCNSKPCLLFPNNNKYTEQFQQISLSIGF